MPSSTPELSSLVVELTPPGTVVDELASLVVELLPPGTVVVEPLSSVVDEPPPGDVVEELSSLVVELPAAPVVTVPSSELVLVSPPGVVDVELSSAVTEAPDWSATVDEVGAESPLAHATPTISNTATIAVKTPSIFLLIPNLPVLVWSQHLRDDLKKASVDCQHCIKLIKLNQWDARQER